MTRAHLILELARICETTHKEAKEILEVVLDGMVERCGEESPWSCGDSASSGRASGGHGTGRNPLTGARVQVPAKRVPFFKPGRELKEMLEQLARPVCGSTDAPRRGGANERTVHVRGGEVAAGNPLRSGGNV